MDTSSETTKKPSLENLSKDEIIKKYQDLIVLLKKAMQNKEVLTRENKILQEKVEHSHSSVTNELVENLTQQKLSLVTNLEEVKMQKDVIHSNLQKSETCLNEAESKINALDIENKTLHRQIERLTEDNEQLLTHLDSLEKQLEKLKDKDALQDMLEIEKNNLRAQLLSKETVMNELQENNNDLTIKYSELKQNIETLEKNYQNAELVISELKMTVKETSKQREIYLSESDDLNTELHKNKALVEKLKQDLKTMSAKLSNNQIELSCYASDLQNTNEKLKEKLKHFHSKIVKFANDVKMLKQEKLGILDSFKSYFQQVKIWEAQLKEYSEQILIEFKTMHVEYSKFKTENDEMKTQLVSVESQLGNENRKLLLNQTLLEEKTSQCESHLEEIAKLNRVNIELTNGLNRTKFVEKELRDEISDLHERNKVVQDKPDTNTFAVQVAIVDEQIIKIRQENSELLVEMNEMNQALKTRGETISKQHEYCDELLENIKQKETVIVEQTELVQHKSEIINKLETQLSSLKSEMEVKNGDAGHLRQSLEKKDEEILQLQKEISTLQENLNATLTTSQEMNYPDSETMSTSTISKTEELNRLKDLDGSWEERYGKLRTLALKLKGKIRDLTIELNKEQTEKLDIQQKLTESIKTSHTLHSQCDKVQDELDDNKNKVKDLLKKLDAAALDISNSKRQLAENDENITTLKSDIEILSKEKTNTDTWKKQVSAKVQSLRKELDANTLLKKDFENQISKLNSQLEAKEKLLKGEIEKHNYTRSSLHESNNECKKQTVLNLEMQDYERSLKDLTTKLEKKQELINKLKTQIDSQKSTVSNIKEENKNLEERLQNGEIDLNAAQNEVQAYKKSIGDLEVIIMQKEDKIQNLIRTLESSHVENENLSSQLSKVVSENQKFCNSLKAEKDYLRGQNMGLEQKLREITDNLRLKESELDETTKEYQGYKVRAQSVLRQNQTRDVGLEEKLTEEVTSFKTQTSVLTSELNDLRNCFDKLNEDNQKLATEKEHFLNKNKELQDSLKDLQKQLEALSAEHQKTIAEHAEAIRGLKIHAETLAQCYRQQLSEQEVRHNREVIELQSKMDKNAFVTEVPAFIPQTVPREQGEGSESDDNNTAHPIPLNRLLSSESDQEVGFLKKQATDNETKLIHLTALLADTEQDLAKHVQMNELLKEEIRRQQRSIEREKHADNLEYLKNVVFKFATLSSGDERSRLVPVLNTILKFSPEEIHKLNLVARSEFGNRGWTNYLPVWSNKPQ